MVFFIFKNKNAKNLIPSLESYLTIMAQRLLYVPPVLILHLCTLSTEFIDMLYMTLRINRNYFPQLH
jgi:hypothetical protein